MLTVEGEALASLSRESQGAAHLGGPELRGRSAEGLDEPSCSADVRVDSGGAESSQLEVFPHLVTQSCHGASWAAGPWGSGPVHAGRSRLWPGRRSARWGEAGFPRSQGRGQVEGVSGGDAQRGGLGAAPLLDDGLLKTSRRCCEAKLPRSGLRPRSPLRSAHLGEKYRKFMKMAPRPLLLSGHGGKPEPHRRSQWRSHILDTHTYAYIYLGGPLPEGGPRLRE